jgi:polar amino acid transport system substrate-binding protein
VTSAVQQTLKEGRVDAIIPLAITPERRQTFDFSDPFLTSGGGFFVRIPDEAPEGPAALSGKTLVTPSAGPLAAYLQEKVPDAKLMLVDSYEDSLAAVIRGDADAAALNFLVGARLAAKLYPGQLNRSAGMFAEQSLALGVTKGKNGELLERLDAGLASIRADGTWQLINDRWIDR